MPTPTPPADVDVGPSEAGPSSPLPTGQATADLARAPAVRWSRAVAVGGLLALIALGLAWELVLAPTGQGTLALKVLPLAWLLAGLMKRRMSTYRSLSLLLWLYVAEGLVRATSDRGTSAVLAGMQVALCLVVFAACAVHVRWRLRHPAAADTAGAGAAAPGRESPDTRAGAAN